MNILSAGLAAFRPFEVDGLPGSGPHEPDKGDIATFVRAVDDSVTALAAGIIAGNVVVKATQALLNADLAHAADTLAVVWNDADPAKQGVYAKVGASGSGSWSPTALFLSGALRADLNAEITFRAARLVASRPAGSALSLIDPQGLAGFDIDDGGVFRVHSVRVRMINGRIAGAHGAYDAQINGVCAYGQSWEVGEASADATAISTTQPYLSLRFVGGVRPDDAGGTTASQRASLVPLIETNKVNKGETPVAGWTQAITELVATEDGITFDRSDYQMLGSCEAVSGQPISALQVGTSPYNAIKSDIDYGFSLSQAMLKSYVFRAISWVQGVGDYTAGTTPATWRAALTAIRSGLDTYAKGVTGQADDVLCIMAQPGWAGSYEASRYPWADLQMLDLSETVAGFVLACPCYFLPLSADTPHFSNVGNKIRGAYYALAYKRVVIDKVAFAPLKPLSIRRQGRVLTVRFNAVSRLKHDTMTVPAQEDMGFSLVTSGGAAIGIDSAKVTGRDTVTLICATAPAAGAKLRYGFPTAASGAGAQGRGNLRDSQGDVMRFDPGGLNHPLHNWCVVFEKALT